MKKIFFSSLIAMSTIVSAQQANAYECTGRCALVVDIASAIVWTNSCPNLDLSDMGVEVLSALKASKKELETAGHAAARSRDLIIAEHPDACFVVCAVEPVAPPCRFLRQAQRRR